ncbi:hypothetical protein Tco_0385222 [Tanacetum coccineum]
MDDDTYKSLRLKRNIKLPLPDSLTEDSLTDVLNSLLRKVYRRLVCFEKRTEGKTIQAMLVDVVKVCLYTQDIELKRVKSQIRKMATTSNIDKAREDKGRMVIAEPEVTNIADLRPIHSNKTIEATVHRKWTSKHIHTRQPTKYCLQAAFKLSTHVISANAIEQTIFKFRTLKIEKMFLLDAGGDSISANYYEAVSGKVKQVQPGKHCTKAQATMPFTSGK